MMSDVMTPGKWEKEYSEGTPHWAKDMEPSVFAKDFYKKLEEVGARTVLEVGCGNGRDSIFFAKKGLNVSAIDVSPSAVELAKSNIEKAKVTVDLQEANAEGIPYPNGYFDGVFSLSVLHSSNLFRTIPEVYRVLKSKGRALIHIYGDAKRSGEQPDVTISVDDYIKLLKASGFAIEDFYTEEDNKKDSTGETHKVYVVSLRKG